jgi:hypothetical protein
VGYHFALLKVKVKIPVTDPKAQRRGRGKAVLFLDLGTRKGVDCQHHAPAHAFKQWVN